MGRAVELLSGMDQGLRGEGEEPESVAGQSSDQQGQQTSPSRVLHWQTNKPGLLPETPLALDDACCLTPCLSHCWCNPPVPLSFQVHLVNVSTPAVPGYHQGRAAVQEEGRSRAGVLPCPRSWTSLLRQLSSVQPLGWFGLWVAGQGAVDPRSSSPQVSATATLRVILNTAFGF